MQFKCVMYFQNISLLPITFAITVKVNVYLYHFMSNIMEIWYKNQILHKSFIKNKKIGYF